MADNAVFDFTADRLQEATALDKLAARGTVRLALKAAGLDAGAVDTRQMLVVLRSVLPAELAKRGVDDAEAVCQRLGESLAKARLASGSADGADRAAAIFARLGNG